MEGGEGSKTALKKPTLIRVKKHRINIRKEVQLKFVVTDTQINSKLSPISKCSRLKLGK